MVAFVLAFLYIIDSNIKVSEKPVPKTKKISHCAVKFEVGESRIAVYAPISYIQPNAVKNDNCAGRD